MDSKTRALRTNRLKPEREMREASLFCFGIEQKLGVTVEFSLVEDQDFDFVARVKTDDTEHYLEVQIKEVVPEELNHAASVQDIVDRLVKYRVSPGLIVAIHLNRVTRFDPAALAVPPDLKIGELWVFGAISKDQSQ